MFRRGATALQVSLAGEYFSTLERRLLLVKSCPPVTNISPATAQTPNDARLLFIEAAALH
jgi:hypothetical protein